MPAVQNQSQPMSQAQYRETPYEDQAWEVVGEISLNKEFEPMEVSVVPRHLVLSDPMFQDFGGMSAETGSKRMHLPEHEVARSAKVKIKDPDAGKVKLLPEELEALKRQAYEEGLAAGKSQGQEEGATRQKVIQKNLQGVIQDLAQQVTQNLRGLEKNAIDLALSISEKIIGYAVEINPEYISKLVQEALTHVGSATIKKVRVSPQDMEFIEVVGIPSQLIDDDVSWKFEKDETVKAGCIVETSAGEVDFRIDQAWERLKDSIIKVAR